MRQDNLVGFATVRGNQATHPACRGDFVGLRAPSCFNQRSSRTRSLQSQSGKLQEKVENVYLTNKGVKIYIAVSPDFVSWSA